MNFLLEQIYTFGAMFVFGIFLGLGYDIYRRLTGKIKHKGLVLNVSDLFFGLVSGCIGFLVLISTNWGELRFYVILAICLGIMGYFYFIKIVNYIK